MSIDILNISSEQWMNDDRRNCAIPDEFSPEEVGAFADKWSPPPMAERAATKLCRGCPVAVQCATYAIERPELEGVWGGTTTTQRAAFRGELGVA